MNKAKLKRYRSLLREIPRLESEIVKLEERLSRVPTVSSKVTKSADEFPYIKTTMTVEAPEPKQATEIKKQIRLKKLQLNRAEREKTEILGFISAIPDSIDREIFELYFLEGISQEKVGETVGLERSSVSKKIDRILQLSHNSQF